MIKKLPLIPIKLAFFPQIKENRALPALRMNKICDFLQQ